MKVCMFHLMPYRDLPADFGERYRSAYLDPLWFDVADSAKVGEYYNATLDELLHAAKAGFHGVCTFLREAPRHIPEVTASAVTVQGLDIAPVRRLAESLGVKFREREYAEVG